MSISAVILNTSYGLTTGGSVQGASGTQTDETTPGSQILITQIGNDVSDIDDLISLLNEFKQASGVRVQDTDDGAVLRLGDGDDSLEMALQAALKAVGGKGDDVISAKNSTADLELIGAAGDDALTGGSGADLIKGGIGDDQLAGKTGADELRGGLGADTIKAGDGNDDAFGGKDNDVLTGGKGLDSLRGNAGQDDITGNGGDDRLNGGSGNDVLKGGKGSDRYVFSAGSGHDTIHGYDMGAGGDTDEMVIGGTDGKLTATQDGDGTLRLWLGDTFDRSIRVEFKGNAADYTGLQDQELADALNIVLR